MHFKKFETNYVFKYVYYKNEFDLLAKVFSTYLPPVYPYDVVGGQRQIKQAQ